MATSTRTFYSIVKGTAVIWSAPPEAARIVRTMVPGGGLLPGGGAGVADKEPPRQRPKPSAVASADLVSDSRARTGPMLTGRPGSQTLRLCQSCFPEEATV